MHAAGAATVELVLPAAAAIGDDTEAAGAVGRAVYADTVLWGTAADGLAAPRGVHGAVYTVHPKRVRRLLRSPGRSPHPSMARRLG
jgi:hypothetical protein